MKILNYGNDYVAQRLVEKPTIAKEVEDAKNDNDPVSEGTDEKGAVQEEGGAEGGGDEGKAGEAAPSKKKGKKKRK